MEVKDVLQAIEKQGEKTDAKIDKLADQTVEVISSINQLVTAIKYSGKITGGTTNGSMWILLFGISGIIFGLMAPVYMMLYGQASSIVNHQDEEGHPIIISKISALTESLKEIETQFDNVDEHIILMRSQMEKDNEREREDASLLGRLDERVKSLEVSNETHVRE